MVLSFLVGNNPATGDLWKTLIIVIALVFIAILLEVVVVVLVYRKKYKSK